MRVRIGSAVSLGALGMMLLGFASQMRADTIFSNFTEPGNTYNGRSYWDTGAVPGTTEVEVNAFSFVPTATATLTGADLALAGGNASTPLTVYIESNTGSGPGAILATLTQTGTYSNYPTTSYVSFACTGSCPTLDAGTEYWIVGQADDAANTTYWMWSYTDTGTWYYNYADSATGPWNVAMSTLPNGNTFGAFDVTGTLGAVPEPASLALLGTGLLGLLTIASSRRASRQEI